MKNKLLSILTFVLTLIVAVPILSACNDNKETYNMSFIKYETTTEYTDLNYHTAVIEVSKLSNSKIFKASDFKVLVNGTKLAGSSFITGAEHESYDDFDTYIATHSQTITVDKYDNTTIITIVFGVEDINQIETLYYKNIKIN